MNQLTALVLTLGIEVPVALGLGAAWGLLGDGGGGRILRIALAGTLLTHPFAWHLLPALHGVLPLFAQLLLVEGGVAVIEGGLYGRFTPFGYGRGQLVGWAANALSFGLGLLLFD
jgi:hypothetical protein